MLWKVEEELKQVVLRELEREEGERSSRKRRIKKMLEDDRGVDVRKILKMVNTFVAHGQFGNGDFDNLVDAFSN